MAKKTQKKKNPVMQQKYEEGFEDGLRQGKYEAIRIFAEKFEGLEKVDGIGKATIEKIITHLGKSEQ
jgi:flagellar biosynthesis/type III secretory pathway protein FliH